MSNYTKNAYQQGDFEGLCGVYAAINACNAVLKLPFGANSYFYEIAIKELDRQGILAYSMLHGIYLPTIRRLLYLFG